MKKIVLLFTLLLLCTTFSFASISRLYVGDLDGQFMAGVDSRIDFGPFFAGVDVRTIIRKTVIDEDQKIVGFLPDRTDYKTGGGVVIGPVEIEYAHTCYHRVISSNDLALYANNQNPADTDIVQMKVFF